MKCPKCVREGGSKEYDSMRGIIDHYRDVHEHFPVSNDILDIQAHD